MNVILLILVLSQLLVMQQVWMKIYLKKCLNLMNSQTRMESSESTVYVLAQLLNSNSFV